MRLCFSPFFCTSSILVPSSPTTFLNPILILILHPRHLQVDATSERSWALAICMLVPEIQRFSAFDLLTKTPLSMPLLFPTSDSMTLFTFDDRSVAMKVSEMAMPNYARDAGTVMDPRYDFLSGVPSIYSPMSIAALLRFFDPFILRSFYKLSYIHEVSFIKVSACFPLSFTVY